MRSKLASKYLQFSLVSKLPALAGGHRETVTPVPIPNTAVKGLIAKGSVGPAHARVGRRRHFLYPEIIRIEIPCGRKILKTTRMGVARVG